MNVYIGANSEKRKRETGSVNETERKGLPGWIEVGGLREEHGDTREENQEIKEERGETREREREREREKLLSTSQVVIRPRFVFT